MQVLYGTPLPPGLVAPTQGELRLRIDQLILDDDSINHNPLVQLFDNEGPSAARNSNAADAVHDGSEIGSSAAPALPTRSPNRFVVPLDYCAVGPIFWGETRPTAHGQPSTPQLRRGPLTMAYPIKIEPSQFRAYLQRMTASPQGGVQLDVFVPSSYSGRPAVTVGKARLPLDQLQPGRPLQGWYPVLHRRPRAAASPSSHVGSEAGTSGTGLAAGDATSLKEIPVGKVKVSVSVEYYPTTRQASSLRPTEHETGSEKAAHGTGKHRRHVDAAGYNALALMPHAKTRRSARHSGRAVAHDAAAFSSSSSSTDTRSEARGNLGPVRFNDRHRLDVHMKRPSASASTLAHDLPAATQRLLEQGLRLRAQMDAAARGGVDGAAPPLFLNGDSLPYDQERKTKQLVIDAALAASFDVDDSREDGKSYKNMIESCDGDDGSDDDSAYTSEASDEENFALQLQKDSEARESRSTQQQQQQTQEQQKRGVASMSAPHAMQNSQMTARSAASIAERGNVINGTAPASVELCFSHFSFAQTPATADLHKLRLSVRLSSDITTNEPTPGPLSSYVHPVPFQQPSICLHFDVCSYTEDRSKLVVEAHKVIAETEVEEGDGADVWDFRGPRQVAREELLGLSVVGLYRQSREVVFRDPVLDSSNVFAQLEIRMQPKTSSFAVPDEELGQGAAALASSPCMTPASEGAPLSSIAASYAPQTAAVATTHVSSATNTPPKPPASPERVTTSYTSPSKGPADTSASKTPPRVSLAVQPSNASSPPPPPPSHGASYFATASERRRLRVVVHSAAELPRVALASPHSRSSARLPLVFSSPRVVAEAGVTGVQSYTEPSTFVTIEELYRTAQHRLTAPERERASESLAKSRARMQAVTDWYVEEARSGYYDRSLVSEQSSNPHFGYEVLVQLPEVPVAVPASTTEESALVGACNDTVGGSEAAAQQRGTVDVLEELQLNVWHSDHTQHNSQIDSNEIIQDGGRSGGSRAKLLQQQEEQFWACAAYMGTCRVDLRPLRYLPMINGYYRVVCERTPNNATDQTDADIDANTIGYVRVSVSLL